MDPKLVIGAAIAGLVVGIAWRVIVARRSRGPARRDFGRVPSNPEFEQLLRKGDRQAAPSTPTPAVIRPAPVAQGPQSAAALLESVRRLQASSAGWPEILAGVNPSGDSKVGELLLRIRGPHQFVPHVALNVLEDACEGVIAANAGADKVEALREAIRRSDVATKVRD